MVQLRIVLTALILVFCEGRFVKLKNSYESSKFIIIIFYERKIIGLHTKILMTG